jgi:anti-anti-sigma regulatory factor
MKIQVCDVVVQQLPERLSGKRGRVFWGELVESMNPDHASIVLDYSLVRQMDRAAVYLLLCCLEEAVKRDGDLKLAAISSEAMAILEFAGVSRLFESFCTIAEAVSSFRRPLTDSTSNAYVPFSSHRAPQNAA